MRFMTIVKSTENHGQPPQALFDAIIKLGQEATAKGAMVGMGGLLPTARGSNVRVKRGKVTVTDGPFAESKEIIGGFAIYETKTKAEAMEWVRRFVQIHIDLWPGFEFDVEVRQMMEDLPPMRA